MQQYTRQRHAARALVLGAGTAGCAAAYQLAEGGLPVVLAERSGQLGGHAEQYGCKAVHGVCQNCGVCLLGELFSKVLTHPLIQIVYNANVWDIRGGMHAYCVVLRTKEGPVRFERLQAVVVATGFDGGKAGFSSHLQIEAHHKAPNSVLSGRQMEAQLARRRRGKLFDTEPQSVAFLGCVGSRDVQQDSFFCSRVCCAYTLRLLHLLRTFYPACHLAYYYMELQIVAGALDFQQLEALDVELVASRPLRVQAGAPASLFYASPGGGLQSRPYTHIVLCEGIYPPTSNAHLADIMGLSQNALGFLDAGVDSMTTGLFVAGCARRPMTICESVADAKRVAMEILAFSSGREAHA